MEQSSASLYGTGVFTTVAVQNHELQLWEKHWRRLINNAKTIDLDLSPYSKISTKTAIAEAVQTSGLCEGRARVTFCDERPSNIWSGSNPDHATRIHIIVGQMRPPPSRFRLTVSPYPVNSRSPLVGVKSCNYLENIISINEVKDRGFHEGIRVNERGHITGGCMSNVYWLKGDRLYTPALSTGCLPGTTREYVLENIDCDEVEAEIDELDGADAIFLTSAGLGIVRVDEFDDRRLGGGNHTLLGLWPPQ
ncbi:MAG: aminotransferase class IV [Chloracidobacterium sp.]|nr:aminotransferase class IV [Chloracidobacterium sp.]